jgi:hypothetical protein
MCDLAEFYAVVAMLLSAQAKSYDCYGLKLLFLLLPFLRNLV